MVPLFHDYTVAQLTALRSDIKKLAGSGSTFREAGQGILNRLYSEFEESLVLARLFATVPFAFLPEREKAFARSLAVERQVPQDIAEDTIVIVLAATRGKKQEWNDPSRSRRRLAVPLLSADFIRTVPLVGRLLGGGMRDIPWLEKQKTLNIKDSMGFMSSLLYIEDARTGSTSEGHKAIPAQYFVESHNIRTVLALGGRYLNGTFLCLVLFTAEQIPEEQSNKFTPLINTIKTATMDVVMDGKIV
jgi:hypothetical protein